MSNFKSKKKNESYRSSLDIVRDILIVAAVSVRKTRIMYQANLSYVQLNKYLNRLLNQNLIKFDGDSFYLTTKKGLDFIKLYEKYVIDQKKIEGLYKQSSKDRIFLEKICSGYDSIG